VSEPSSNSVRTALVTGGAGFIGHHLATALAGRGYRVRVLDDLSRGSRARIDTLAGAVEFISGSVLDERAAGNAMQGVDVVFHEAAWVSVPHSVERPVEYHEVNATGALKVLEAARRAEVKRVVYASSSSIYGESEELPKRESMRAEPISPYAVSKYTGELYTSVYAKVYGMQTVSLRYFNVFGPGQDPKSLYGAAIPAIVGRMIRGERPTLFGDGMQTRDFCYVENVVNANILAAEAQGVAGEAVNIACGERIAVIDIVHLTNRILGTSIEPVYAPARTGDVKHSLADLSEAERVIGYRPRVFFEEGLKRVIAEMKGVEAGRKK
jgi:UDP-glucose 4-epimerase